MCAGWWAPLVSVQRGISTQESRGKEMIDALAGPVGTWTSIIVSDRSPEV